MEHWHFNNFPISKITFPSVSQSIYFPISPFTVDWRNMFWMECRRSIMLHSILSSVNEKLTTKSSSDIFSSLTISQWFTANIFEWWCRWPRLLHWGLIETVWPCSTNFSGSVSLPTSIVFVHICIHSHRLKRADLLSETGVNAVSQA